MNRNDYRRALVMLRSLKNGVSGYVRLERRTLMGTLQFTINGAPSSAELYALLIYRKNGSYGAIRLEAFGAPRYGQVGLVWKFDPRNIEGRTLEQYDLAAVIEIRDGICDLILSGNLNGSVEVDWTQVREAACRLFSPVRISGAPISPIDEHKAESEEISPSESAAHQHETALLEEELGDDMPPSSEECPCMLEEEGFLPENTSDPDAASVESDDDICPTGKSSAPDVPSDAAIEPDEPDAPAENAIEPDELDAPAEAAIEPDELDAPAEAAIEPDELDAPAEDAIEPDELDAPAEDAIEPDELDCPADNAHSSASLTDDSSEEEAPSRSTANPPSAGEQLGLNDPEAPWPDSIEPLRSLFFSSEAIVPFKAEGYVFIRAPLPEESGSASCVCGLHCENGAPSKVCYAIPAQYSADPPAGLEDYVWHGDHVRGYWMIFQSVSSS